jgi:magnesium chelatase subunit D
VALDEGAEPDERVAESLLDRMAFHVDLSEVSLGEADVELLREAAVMARRGRPDGLSNVSWPGERARERGLARPPTSFAEETDLGAAVSAGIMGQVVGGRAKPGHDTGGAVGPDTGGTAVEALGHAALALGIDSPRAPLFALRAAYVAAVLDGRRCPNDADLGLAARLVLAPRATRFPPPEDAEPPPPAPEQPPPEDSATPPELENLPDQPLEDVVLEAALAALPPDLLARLAQIDGGQGLARAAGRAGQFKASNKRGRPVGTRPGEPTGGARLHLLETLKAAAPWQTLRRRSADSRRFEVRRDDFRIMRFRQRIGTTTIFAVDASGSAAMARLGEAKGAVELLLADCYVRRDQVALLAFRGTGATLLLAPTGSLLRAKRCLAGLPGGGPTPLAAGIEAAATLAGSIRRAGRTPVITLLTDARANIGRDGSGGRPRAEAEALEAARALRNSGVATLLVDTSPRPNPFAKKLADEMHAQYVPLPYADATALSRAVRSIGAA